MPPGDMPLPDLDASDDRTFKGRLYKYGAGASDNIEDRRDGSGNEAKDRKAKKDKPKPAPIDEGGKLATDAGINDIGKKPLKRSERWYGS